MKKNIAKFNFFSREKNQNIKNKKYQAALIALMLFCLSPLHAQRDPININIIVDSSASLSSVKQNIESWLSFRLDEIIVTGDKVTIWSASARADVIYENTVNAPDDKEAIKESVRNITPSGYSADFSGALQQAARQTPGSYTYTLLVSASSESLSSLITGPYGSLIRYSRVEEFTSWRALVIGLNIDSRVRTAASAFINN
ncbi:MAG: hypothetical protein FWC21_03135 [Treponema sp.]|nr:hypothetical protein [Treponema sp.]